MKSNYFYLVVLVTTVISTPQLLSGAHVSIDSNTTIDSRTEDFLNIFDGDMPPTVVEIVDGAEILGEVTLNDTSIVNMRGGTTKVTSSEFGFFAFLASGRSTLNVFNGSIRHISTGGGSAIIANENSTVNLHDGSFSGDSDSILAGDQSMINIHGGAFSATVRNSGGSILNIFEGAFSGRIETSDDGTLNIHDGDFRGIAEFNGRGNGSLGSSESGTLNIFGGVYEGPLALHADEQSILNIHGGEFIPVDGVLEFALRDEVMANIFGTNLSLIDNHLTGVLQDGSPIDAMISFTKGNPTIVLHTVPEPSSLLQSGIAVLSSLWFLASSGGFVR